MSSESGRLREWPRKWECTVGWCAKRSAARLPKPRKKTERPRWKLKAAVEFIDAILEGDRKAPRKQRHTAHRIWVRMQHELAEWEIAERTVREYVHERKIALGFIVRETCVPQS